MPDNGDDTLFLWCLVSLGVQTHQAGIFPLSIWKPEIMSCTQQSWKGSNLNNSPSREMKVKGNTAKTCACLKTFKENEGLAMPDNGDDTLFPWCLLSSWVQTCRHTQAGIFSLSIWKLEIMSWTQQSSKSASLNNSASREMKVKENTAKT